jgi:predicted enzyme related to lactoylglutathione lyase
MSRPVLGSVLIGSANAQRLREWYLAAFDPQPSNDGFLDFGGTAVLFDGRDDVTAAAREPGRVVLNFHVADALATARRLDELGVSWLVEVERRPDGLFGTAMDPDGNYIQIIELSEEYLARTRKA